MEELWITIGLWTLIVLLVPIAVFYALRKMVKFYKYVNRLSQSKRYRAEEYVLLRMRVPRNSEKGPIVMEQIFASLYGVFKKPKLRSVVFGGFGQPKFSFEIVNNGGRINFYAHAPKKYRKFVEGQFYAQYPGVEIEIVSDYLKDLDVDVTQRKTNVDDTSRENMRLMAHNPHAATATALGAFENVRPLDNAVVGEMTTYGDYLWPIRTYKEFITTEDKTIVDPLASITTTLSHLNHPTDIASIQVVVRPEHYYWQKFGWKLYESYFKAGFFHSPNWFMNWFVEFYSVNSWLYHVMIYIPLFFMKLAWRLLGRVDPIEGGTVLEKQEVGFSYWDIPRKKLTTIGFQTDIRMMYVPKNKDVNGAYHKIQEMAAGFNQFQYPYVNGIGIKNVSQSKELIRRFVERDFSEKIIFGIDELATVFHLPHMSVETPNVQWVLSKKLEPPVDLPTPEKFGEDITIIGKTNFRGQENFFGIKTADRRRHLYIIGKTGMGKSTLLENMIYSDIYSKKGVAVIDPHGDLADYVLKIVPSFRVNDVILFDPSDTEFPISFNMLECGNPEQRNLVASGLLGIFKKMYADSWGPRLEHILRNTILALTEYPGATMLGILRMLTDETFRTKVVEKITNPVVKSFWLDEFARMDQKFRTEAVAPIQNKVGQFLSSPIIRNILGQPKSSINIRFAMDTKKIIIVNLSKGKIGEDNSSLLGSMMVTKFQLDAMSRADVTEAQREDFYLYVDEFQNFATDSFATILSEARKYKLNLTMANQYIEQMPEEVQAAVFGNVGSLFTFQVGYTDAEYIAQQFGDEELTNDILSLEKYTGYMRLLIDNMPSRQFSVKTLASPEPGEEANIADRVRKVSRERYTNERRVVEDKIQRWTEQSQLAHAQAKQLAEPSIDDIRHEKNKDEFENVMKDAGISFSVVPKESYEAMGIDKTTNEHVYIIQNSQLKILNSPQGKIFCFSSLDPQGNCFKKKRSEMLRFFKQDEVTKMFTPVGRKVAKTAHWQHYLREALEDFGGKEYDLPKGVPINEDYDYRHAGNKNEVEEILTKTGIPFALIARDDYEKYGISKSVNEHVYNIDIKGKHMLFYSTIDPQGNTFRKKKFDSFKLYKPGDKKHEAEMITEEERDGRWKKILLKNLNKLIQ